MKENKGEDAKSRAPDGGWGWFVCLGSSLITVKYNKVAIVLIGFNFLLQNKIKSKLLL